MTSNDLGGSREDSVMTDLREVKENLLPGVMKRLDTQAELARTQTELSRSNHKLTKRISKYLLVVASTLLVVAVAAWFNYSTLTFLQDLANPDGKYQKKQQAIALQQINLLAYQQTVLDDIGDLSVSIANPNSSPEIVATRKETIEKNQATLLLILQNIDDLNHNRPPRNDVPLIAVIPEEPAE